MILNGWEVLIERSALFFAMGIVVGCVRLISGSLWAAIGFHVAFQVVMQLFLNRWYAAIDVSDEGTFTAGTAVVAFLTAATLAGFLWRGEQNWSRPDPESVETSAS